MNETDVVCPKPDARIPNPHLSPPPVTGHWSPVTAAQQPDWTDGTDRIDGTDGIDSFFPDETNEINEMNE